MSLDDIEFTFLRQGLPTSTYSNDDNFLDIQNAIFGMEGYNLFDYGSWDSPLFDMSGYIIFPQGFDSVESILGDDSDAPVEYYNLQGVKVMNPEKGQLVIVRKGNKAAKVII